MTLKIRYLCGDPVIKTFRDRRNIGEIIWGLRACPECGPLLDLVDYLKVSRTIHRLAGNVLYVFPRTVGLARKEGWKNPRWWTVGHVTVSTRKPRKSWNIWSVQVVNMLTFLNKRLLRILGDWDKNQRLRVLVSRLVSSVWRNLLSTEHEIRKIEDFLKERGLTKREIDKFFYLCRRNFPSQETCLFLEYKDTPSTPKNWETLGVLEQADWMIANMGTYYLCKGGKRLLKEASAMREKQLVEEKRRPIYYGT